MHASDRDVRAAIITISTSKAAGQGQDESGAALARVAERLGAQIAVRRLVSDDRAAIEAALRQCSAVEQCALVLTTGGTGVAPSDVTPEATRAVLEREIPGIPEAMRAASRPHTPHWMLSRAAAGICGSSLIVNFPGSPRSIGQVADELLPSLEHALALLAGLPTAHR